MSEANTTPTAAASSQTVFNIEKLYVKDISLEIPNAPGVFLERDPPQIDLQIHSQANQIEDGLFEVQVTATVTAKLAAKDNKIMFLIEATQVGIFQIRNLPPAEIAPVLGVVCPNILYPYLREVISAISSRAGFATVLLHPINFDAVYQKQKLAEANGAVKH
jgi:preprotein translocase subunit SecB